LENTVIGEEEICRDDRSACTPSQQEELYERWLSECAPSTCNDLEGALRAFYVARRRTKVLCKLPMPDNPAIRSAFRERINEKVDEYARLKAKVTMLLGTKDPFAPEFDALYASTIDLEFQ
jgi:hypothetical protein